MSGGGTANTLISLLPSWSWTWWSILSVNWSQPWACLSACRLSMGLPVFWGDWWKEGRGGLFLTLGMCCSDHLWTANSQVLGISWISGPQLGFVCVMESTCVVSQLIGWWCKLEPLTVLWDAPNVIQTLTIKLWAVEFSRKYSCWHWKD